ncbi:MAG: SpoIID/LytB domain-containing protein, partial [Candidatus Omnitrophica bacterium]|nr:SpoIID/LytB domain-containing protein [Candidatus Omnitrophota bacterium]
MIFNYFKSKKKGAIFIFRKKISVTLFLVFSILFNFFAFSGDDNYLDIAALFKETLEYDKAIEVLLHSPQALSDPRAQKYLGRLYYLTGQAEKSLKVLNDLEKKDWQVLIYLGLIYEDLGDSKKAIESYSTSIKLKNNTISLYRLAKISYHDQNYKEASKTFLRAINLDSSIRPAYYFLGNCFLQIEDYKQAYRYFSKALNFYPNSNQVKEKVASAKSGLGKDYFSSQRLKKEQARGKVKLSPYTRASGSSIRVGIAKGIKQFTFKSGESFKINEFKAEANKFYTIIFKHNKFSITSTSGDILHETGGPLKIVAKVYPFYIFDINHGKGSFWHKQVDRLFRGNLEVVSKNKTITLVNILTVEDYLYGVLSAEISSKANSNALKAQSVAARTIAIRSIGRHKKDGFDVCCDVHCQVYKGMSAETKATTNAINATSGEILTYKNKAIDALYHSNCGGCLRRDAFGDVDYLITKCDSLADDCQMSAYGEEEWFMSEPKDNFSYMSSSSYRWQRMYDQEDLVLFFKGIKAIAAVEKGDCAHYKAMKVTGKEEKVLKTDWAIRNNLDNLRSTAFKFERKTSPDGDLEGFLFWGGGFGHGSGLCQDGAVNMAKKGYKYRKILQHYYPNTNLEKK